MTELTQGEKLQALLVAHDKQCSYGISCNEVTTIIDGFLESRFDDDDYRDALLARLSQADPNASDTDLIERLNKIAAMMAGSVQRRCQNCGGVVINAKNMCLSCGEQVE